MASDPAEHEPKLTDADIIMGVVLLGVLDAIDFVEFGVPGTDIVGFPIEQYFLNSKGVSGTTALIGNILELIPGADYLPMRTACWLITAWMDRHPSELTEKIEEAGDLKQKIEGKGKGGAGGAAKAGQAGETPGAAPQAAATARAGQQSASGVSAAGGGANAEGQRANEKSETGEARSAQREAAGAGERSAGTEQPEIGGEGPKRKSLEEQMTENTIRGRDIENVMLETFGAEPMLAGIETPELGSKIASFDPNRRRPEEPMAAPVPRPSAGVEDRIKSGRPAQSRRRTQSSRPRDKDEEGGTLEAERV